MKIYQNQNVYDASVERIDFILDNFNLFYVSLSGGKDSGVLVNLVLDRARAKGRLPVPVMFFDWETCYKETVDFVERIMTMKEVEPYWICLPECEDNGSSIFERYWKPWDSSKKDKWVRPMPLHDFVINESNMPGEWRKWYTSDSYSLWVVKKFGDWLAQKKGVDKASCMLGLRTAESYGRHMCIAAAKFRDKMTPWCYRTKDSGERTWITLPIYDWTVQDIWTCNGRNHYDYNRTYDKFYLAGKTLEEMRICNALGEAQKRDLDQWHAIEPETWARLVERVQGANFGAIYNGTDLNRLKTKKPEGSTWEAWTEILLNSLPPEAMKNYDYRFGVIKRWFEVYSGQKMGLTRWWFDTKKEAKQFAAANGISICYVGSWETMANFILKRDWMCKKYGFAESARTDEAVKRLFEKYKDI